VTTAADRLEGLDVLQSDMAAHQRTFAGEVSAEDNRLLAAALFERMDQRAAASPTLVSAPSEPPTELRADVEGREYRIVRTETTEAAEAAAAAPRSTLLADPRTFERYEKMQARVNLLLGKAEPGPLGAPSWRARVLAALYWGNLSAAQLRRVGLTKADADRCMAGELKAVLDDSSRLFGDWRTVATRVVGR
jgi:hypothetical protein